MHVEICDEELDDYRQHYAIEVTVGDTITTLDFHDGEPEDNNLCRNFSNVYAIPELIELAYKAGLAGEELTFGPGEELKWRDD